MKKMKIIIKLWFALTIASVTGVDGSGVSGAFLQPVIIAAVKIKHAKIAKILFFIRESSFFSFCRGASISSRLHCSMEEFTGKEAKGNCKKTLRNKKGRARRLCLMYLV